MSSSNSLPQSTGHERIQKLSTGKAHQGGGEERRTNKSVYSRKRITLLSNGRIRTLETLSPGYPVSQNRDPRQSRPSHSWTPGIHKDLLQDCTNLLLAEHGKRYTETCPGMRCLSTYETLKSSACRTAASTTNPHTTLGIHRHGLFGTSTEVGIRKRHDPRRNRSVNKDGKIRPYKQFSH